MKAIVCGVTGQVEIFSFGTEWTACRCGLTKAKWLDPISGRIVVATRGEKSMIRFLGLNNHMFRRAFEVVPLDFDHFKEVHEQCTDAPGYLFDKSRMSCWAILVTPGESSDSRWATPEEMKEAFPN